MGILVKALPNPAIVGTMVPQSVGWAQVLLYRVRIIQNSERIGTRYEFRHFRERFPETARASFPRQIAGHIPNRLHGIIAPQTLQNAPHERAPKRTGRSACGRPGTLSADIQQTGRQPAWPTTPRYAPSPFPPGIDPAARPATSASATARAPIPAANQNSSAAPNAPASSTC